jgi:hypothetical protein
MFMTRAWRKTIAVVHQVNTQCYSHLPFIIQAKNLLTLPAGRSQARQQYRQKQGYNAYHSQ